MGFIADFFKPLWTPRKPRPHKHSWKFITSIGAYWDAGSYDLMECMTCGSQGKRWRGVTKATKRSDLCKSLPHEHEWCFEYYGGRKEGASQDTPMSEICSCECGLMSVRHFGEKEYTILSAGQEKSLNVPYQPLN